MELRRKYRTHQLLLSLLIVGILVLWLKPIPESSTLCIFKTATGIACPSCGTGHGIESLLNGHFREAWNYNPFSYIVAAGTILLISMLISDLIFGRNYLAPLLKKMQMQLSIRNPFTWLCITLVLVNWYRTIQHS
jgi:hypothetical protein